MKFKSLLFVVTYLLLSTSVEAINHGNPNAPKGGTFNTRLTSIPSSLHPQSSSDYGSQVIHSYVYDTLLTTDPNTYKPLPGLAESWTKSDDNLVFTFKLRKGVKWEDGKEFTAEDIVFSYNAPLHPKNKYEMAHIRPYFSNFSKFEAIDKYTFKATAKTAYYKNFEVLGGAYAPILPKHIYENPTAKEKKKHNKTLIGLGAYKLSKYSRTKGITLTRNKNWWGNKVEHLKNTNNFDKIQFRIIKDTNVAITRIEKGDLDYLGLSADEYVKKTTNSRWGKTVLKKKIKNKGPKGYTFIGWNNTHPIFKSVEVRKAMAHLLNRKLMIDKFFYGLYDMASGPVVRSSDYADQSVKPIQFDPKMALEILRKEGWKDTDNDQILDKVIDGKKTKLSFTILEPLNDFVKYLTIFKEDAKKAGVDVNIKLVDWTTFIKLLDERNFDAMRLAWGSGSIDWEPKQIWHSGSIDNKGSNFVAYRNTEVDKNIELAGTIFDKEKRIKVLNKVYKQIAEDAPYAFLFNSAHSFYGHNKRIKMTQDTFKYSIGQGYWWIGK